MDSSPQLRVNRSTTREQVPEKQKPKHWAKRVAAAYLRMQGKTQEETAAGVGRSRRTIYELEQDTSMWEIARAEARALWMNDTEDAARRAVHDSISLGNAELAWRFLERVDQQFEPKQKHELSGPRG